MTTIEQTETATRDNPNLNESPEALPPTSEKKTFLDRKSVKPVIGFVVPVVVFVTWWAVTATEGFTPVQLPSRSPGFDARDRRLQGGELWMHGGHGVRR